MADTSVLTDNGSQPPEPSAEEVDRRLSLPETIGMTTAEMSRVPSPGTQRRLKAETGRTFDDLVGGDADSADRFQTFIWMKLRRTVPGLRWADCDEVEVQIEDAPGVAVDPTKLVASTTSPPSVASGD